MEAEDYSQFDIEGYKVIRELGRGEFGRVYLARDKDGNEVAIKTIKKSELKNIKRRKLFQTERDIMRKINN